MGRALALARRGMGATRPNPPVGAVLLRDGVIVGEGRHEAAGREHAEIVALRQAGERARGATLLVTLAPCNHHGRTPPCAPEIVRAGVARVHFGALDPNRGSGSGVEALRAAGIEVIQGPNRREAEVLIAGFASLVERKRPRIALKAATSLDGRIAAASGDSKWISSTIARAWAHRRRREADAILVGSGTALKDNPQLTTRSVKGRSPDRFVLDSKLRTPPAARVWAQDGARRVAVTTESAPPEAAGALRGLGVEVWTLPADANGRPDLQALAARMGEDGYTNLLVEGGGTVAGALFAAQLVDVAWVVMARHMLLGGGGPGWTEGLRVPSVARAPKIARTELRKLGPDWLITLVPESATWWDPEIAHV
jgi:diaminohydroxyphosphoribosylaminopyrimidine deaminase/5-amino-6-(5-phosphoribosylamino)uracil reductase